MSTTIQHLAAAWKCVAELEQLGCTVLSVCAYPHEDAPRIHIADHGSLLDHIDAMSVDCSMVEYVRQGVRVAGCDVFWLFHAGPQPADDLREALS
jgi:hypothetical protein